MRGVRVEVISPAGAGDQLAVEHRRAPREHVGKPGQLRKRAGDVATVAGANGDPAVHGDQRPPAVQLRLEPKGRPRQVTVTVTVAVTRDRCQHRSERGGPSVPATRPGAQHGSWTWPRRWCQSARTCADHQGDSCEHHEDSRSPGIVAGDHIE